MIHKDLVWESERTDSELVIPWRKNSGAAFCWKKQLVTGKNNTVLKTVIVLLHFFGYSQTLASVHGSVNRVNDKIVNSLSVSSCFTQWTWWNLHFLTLFYSSVKLGPTMCHEHGIVHTQACALKVMKTTAVSHRHCSVRHFWTRSKSLHTCMSNSVAT